MLRILLASLFTLLLASPVMADTSAGAEKVLSPQEQAFLDAIGGLSKDKVVAQLGEPARKEELLGPNGETVASIWQYDYLNTDEKGEYYKSTELDFVDDKVVTVVFMNTDEQNLPAKKK